MRKLTVGLIAVALLATAAPARAQWADPLGLIASGLIIPYVGNGNISPGSFSFLEVYAPVRDESGFHMFFFDTTCARRGDSVGLPLTANDVALLRVDNLGGANPVEGLIAAADVDGTGFNLIPMASAVHARVLWVTGQGTVRTLEPISIWNPETAPVFFNQIAYTWNPLRSGATFFAPHEGGGLATTIYFVCPTTNITNDINNFNAGAFPINSGFPPLLDQSLESPLPAGTPTPLRVRVFDTDERFLRDVTHTCTCLSASPVLSISQVYGSAVEAPEGTYTEIEGASTKAVPAGCGANQVGVVNQPADDAGGPVPPPTCGVAFATTVVGPGVPCGNGDPAGPSGQCITYNLFNVITPAIPAKGPVVFTGYRGIRFGAADVFGRLSNGNALSIQGTGVGLAVGLSGVNGLGSFDFFNPR
jgi:hypothetical protein